MITPLRSGLILFCIALGAPRPAGAFAQERTAVQGEVIDARTGAPIEGAVVVVEGASQVAITDDHGYFALTGVVVGLATIRVARIGYAPVTGVSEVQPSEIWTVFLNPQAIEIGGLVASVRGTEAEAQRASGTATDYVSPREIDAIRNRVQTSLDVIRKLVGPRLSISVGAGSASSGATVKYCVQSTRRRPSLMELRLELPGGCRPSLLVIDGVVIFDPMSALDRRGLIQLNGQASEMILSIHPEDIEDARFLQPLDARLRFGEPGKNGALIINTRH